MSNQTELEKLIDQRDRLNKQIEKITNYNLLEQVSKYFNIKYTQCAKNKNCHRHDFCGVVSNVNEKQITFRSDFEHILSFNYNNSFDDDNFISEKEIKLGTNIILYVCEYDSLYLDEHIETIVEEINDNCEIKCKSGISYVSYVNSKYNMDELLYLFNDIILI